jgi:hypothetical protein
MARLLPDPAQLHTRIAAFNDHNPVNAAMST